MTPTKLHRSTHFQFVELCLDTCFNIPAQHSTARFILLKASTWYAVPSMCEKRLCSAPWNTNRTAPSWTSSRVRWNSAVSMTGRQKEGSL